MGPSLARRNVGMSAAGVIRNVRCLATSALGERPCENRLLVTGKLEEVNAFRRTAESTPPALLAFLPRGLAFTVASEPATALTFQTLVPSRMDPLHDWGCTTDACAARLLRGPARAKGRTSIVYEFITGEEPPLRWLQAATERHPALSLGLKCAMPHKPAAYEHLFSDSRCLARMQVSYYGWLWDHKVQKKDLFQQLKSLLCFPDDRVPKKRRLKVKDVEVRLHAQGSYAHALELLSHYGWGESSAAFKRRVKAFHTVVLPEFVAWLYCRDEALLAGWS